MRKVITRILLFIMFVCVGITYFALSVSGGCDTCGATIRGKYYISMTDDIMCKNCSEKYYASFPEGTEKKTAYIDNNIRNYMCVVELVLFGCCIFYLNKKKKRIVNRSVDELTIGGKKRSFITRDKNANKKTVNETKELNEKPHTEELSVKRNKTEEEEVKSNSVKTVVNEEKQAAEETAKPKDLGLKPAGDL